MTATDNTATMNSSIYSNICDLLVNKDIIDQLDQNVNGCFQNNFARERSTMNEKTRRSGFLQGTINNYSLYLTDRYASIASSS